MAKNNSANLSNIGNRLVVAALRLLQRNGPMPAANLISELQGNSLITAELRGTYSDGTPKWLTTLRFQSIRFTRAGLLRKERRIWSLTEEGKQQLEKRGDNDVIRLAFEKYAEWNRAQQHELPSDAKSSADNIKPEDASGDDDIGRQGQESRARDGIMGFIQKMDPYEFQNLVAALLRAMGYFVSSVSVEKGGDGGVDIVAYDNPIGASGARLKVQVKHYKDSSVSPKDLRELHGLLTEGETGVFVCTSAFSPKGREFARTAQKHLRLIDGDEFIRLWIEFHPKMRDEDKKRLPLYAVHFLDEETIPD